MVKLFITLLRGEVFHFGDAPWLQLTKRDDTHYTAPTGPREIHPHVAVITNSHRYLHNTSLPTKDREGVTHE